MRMLILIVKYINISSLSGWLSPSYLSLQSGLKAEQGEQGGGGGGGLVYFSIQHEDELTSAIRKLPDIPKETV